MICDNCFAETYNDRPRHPDLSVCVIAWRTILAQTMIPVSFAQQKIEACRKRRHIGSPVLEGKDVCTRCLAAGFAAYSSVEKMLGFFSRSKMEGLKGENGSEQRPNKGHGESAKRTVSQDDADVGGGRKPG